VQSNPIDYKRTSESGTRSERTRIRLLTAASRIFAERGFQDATIAEICKQADTHIAAVNYHFGDKETIYLEAWRFTFKRELAEFPPDGGVNQNAPPEIRLAGRVKALIRRMTDDRAYSFAIVHREMAHPTRLLANILEQEIHPQRIQMINLIKLCLDADANDPLVQYCHASIMGQCFQLLRLKHIQHSRPQFESSFDLNDVDAFADHVIRFSLAGIRALRKPSV